MYYSSYVSYLMELGVKFFNVIKFYQFHESRIFDRYLAELSEKRLEAQVAGNEPRSNLIKNMCNSLYGSTLRSQEKDTICKFSSSRKEYLRYASDPLLVSATDYSDGLTEFTMRKSNVLLKSPITIGAVVLFHSKRYLLEFYYGFVKKFISDYLQWPVYCDTDCWKLALAADSLTECVPQHRMAEFKLAAGRLLVDQTDKQSILATKRPGKWAVESRARCFIGLAAKSYFECDDLNQQYPSKLSVKGISKKTNSKLLKRDLFKSILFGRKPPSFKNVGILRKSSAIVSYVCDKRGLTAAFYKRYVLDNRVHTVPYDWI